MSNWRPINYRDFYDVPWAIYVSDGTKNYFFSSEFDEAADDYRDKYDVYEMPKMSDEALNGSWLNVERKAIRHIGRVPVKDIKLDKTKRRLLNLDILKLIKAK